MRKFGPYTLIQQIAVGGMAEIHLARTDGGIAGFEKYVAIKMIHSQYSSDQNFIQMLIDEAKITVQLSHVNIAQTYDLGRVGDIYYITMEYVDGSDLYKLLRIGAEKGIDVPIDVAAYIVKEAALGLDHAHRKRDDRGQLLHIIHRDISPQNVLVSAAGEVKVIDFGIAKANLRDQNTAVGVIKGKYFYMSPEQASGRRLDPRTDIFSLGIILYELLVGQMLYLEEDIQLLVNMVTRADIQPPSKLRPDIPVGLEAIVMRALSKNPNDRFASAFDFANRLERLLSSRSVRDGARAVTQWTQRVLSDDPDSVSTPSNQRDQNEKHRVGEELLSERDDFSDGNSVIFRSHGAVRSEDETFVPRDAEQSTQAMYKSDLQDTPVPPVSERYLDEEEARTEVSRPGFSVAQGFLPAQIPNEEDHETIAIERPDTEEEASTVQTAKHWQNDPLVGVRDPVPSSPVSAEWTAVPNPPETVSVAPADNVPTDSIGPVSKTPMLVIVGRASDIESVSGHTVAPSQKKTLLYGEPAVVSKPAMGGNQTRGDSRQPFPPQPLNRRIPAGGSVKPGTLQKTWILTGIAILVIVILVGIIAGSETPSKASLSQDLWIVSTPPGATVRVDGVPLDERTPTAFSGRPGETYSLLVQLEGYAQWQQEHLWDPSIVELTVSLIPRKVTVVVRSQPSGADVYLEGDSTSVGVTPLTIREVAPDAVRRLELKKVGYQPVTRELDWREDDEKVEEFTLVR